MASASTLETGNGGDEQSIMGDQPVFGVCIDRWVVLKGTVSRRYAVKRTSGTRTCARRRMAIIAFRGYRPFCAIAEHVIMPRYRTGESVTGCSGPESFSDAHQRSVTEVRGWPCRSHCIARCWKCVRRTGENRRVGAAKSGHWCAWLPELYSEEAG